MESGCGCDACCDCGQDFRRIQLHRPNSAFIDGQRFLYAANFTKGRVDVYDNAFHLVDLSKQHFDEDSADQEDRHSAENSFADEKLPRSYVPFNCKPSATILSSPTCSARKVRALKPAARDLVSWTFTAPRAGSCAVSNTVIG